MKLTRLLYPALLFLSILITLLAAGYYFKFKGIAISAPPVLLNEVEKIKLENIAGELVAFNKGKLYNEETVFIADMNLPSGKNRFFIYNPKLHTVINSALVTHGRCNKTWLYGREYSNTVGSGCTSPGRYKIGKSYYGKFGLAYKLHGLDKTNSNAYKRYVVLHAHECVPAEEIDPYPLCQSDGCPTVSPECLKILQKIIDNSPKPVLLYISP